MDNAITPLIRHLMNRIQEAYIKTHARRLPPERHLEKKLGASRVSIRRALSALEAEDLVYMLPGGRIRYVKQRPGGDLRSETIPGEHPLNASYTFPREETNSVISLRVMPMDLTSGTSQASQARWHSWAEMFREKNPRIGMRLSQWPACAFDQLPSALADVDVVELPTSYRDLLRENNWSLPLRPFLESDPSYHAPAPAPNQADINEFKEAVPFGVTLPCLIVNADLWTRYGADPLPEPWTWMVALDIFENLAQKTGRPAFQFTCLLPFFLACGYRPWAAGERPPKTVAGILRRAFAIMDTSPEPIRGKRVANGESACLWMTVSGLPNMEERFGNALRVLPFPCEPDGFLLRHTLSFFINSQTPHPTEAWQWIRFLADQERQRELGALHHLIPVNPAGHETFCQGAEFGDLSPVLSSLARSATLPLTDLQTSLIDGPILSAEVASWLRKDQDEATMFLRMALRSRLVLESR